MTPRPIGRLALPALAALAVCAGPASAQSGATPTQRQVAQACMPDIRAHCSGVERGGGRILACLQQNSDRLTPTCRQALNTLPR